VVWFGETWNQTAATVTLDLVVVVAFEISAGAGAVSANAVNVRRAPGVPALRCWFLAMVFLDVTEQTVLFLERVARGPDFKVVLVVLAISAPNEAEIERDRHAFARGLRVCAPEQEVL
jgi:hypothetical protein